MSKWFTIGHKGEQQMTDKRRQAGFTIIELMLAMIFVSFILIFMALTIVQMLRIYDKAISMKQVNQAGRTITEDINEAMRSQAPDRVDVTKIDQGFICIGATVYHWNPLFEQGGSGATLFDADPSNSDAPIIAATGATMVRKVFRSENTACTAGNVTSNSPTMFEPDSEAPLLSSRSRVIWATATTYPTAASGSAQPKLVELTFILGTYDRNEVDTGVERGWLEDGNAGSYENFTVTPHREKNGSDAKITCLPGSSGNYCSFAEFKTVVYISRKQ